jgi:PAS domain S-box-containing protein
MALFRNSADILFVVRVTQPGSGYVFTYESFSPSLEKQTGWRPEDLIGRSPHQTLPQAAAEIVLANYRRCVAARSTISYTTTYETPLGPREFEGSLTPVQHPGSSETVRLVGSLRDVTERNRLIESLHHSQKMEAIGRLAAGVAHDFNNVLQSIFSSLELVQEENRATGGEARGTIEEYTGIALHSAKRGAYLTNHLLSYARKQVLLPKTIVLADLLSEIEKLLVRTLGPHITVKVRVDRSAPAVFADPAELETALLNLAINASHAMAQGGVLAIDAVGVVEADRQTDRPTDRPTDRHWAAITVTDTGTGMDAQTLAHATEPFFTTKGPDGTGLGLSMVQGFAAQSGGTLRIASKPGEGTTIELRLPAAAGIAGAAILPTVTAAEPKRAGSILLVDDDSDVLMTVGAFLQKDGFQVVRAAGGNQALAVLASDQRIDAIVTDFAMPGLNGADLVAEARLIRPGVPAVVISGFLDIGTSLPPGGVIMLRKPFQRDALIRLVRQAIAGQAEAVSEGSLQLE